MLPEKVTRVNYSFSLKHGRGGSVQIRGQLQFGKLYIFHLTLNERQETEVFPSALDGM